MKIKLVDGIKMKNGMDEVLITKGAVTTDGKYVVAAQGRFASDAKWTPSRKGNGTEFCIPMRLDIGIAEYGENGQGDFLFPYTSGRVLRIKGNFGSRMTVVTQFDNESRNQYKNAVINPKIFDAMKEAIKFAIKDAIARAKDGKAMVTASNSEYIEDADAFLDMSEKIASLKSTTDVTGAGTVNSAADDVASAVLGV